MNDNNVIRDRKEKSGILCYKILALHESVQCYLKVHLHQLQMYVANFKATTKQSKKKYNQYTKREKKMNSY